MGIRAAVRDEQPLDQRDLRRAKKTVFQPAFRCVGQQCLEFRHRPHNGPRPERGLCRADFDVRTRFDLGQAVGRLVTAQRRDWYRERPGIGGRCCRLATIWRVGPVGSMFPTFRSRPVWWPRRSHGTPHPSAQLRARRFRRIPTARRTQNESGTVLVGLVSCNEMPSTALQSPDSRSHANIFTTPTLTLFN